MKYVFLLVLLLIPLASAISPDKIEYKIVSMSDAESYLFNASIVDNVLVLTPKFSGEKNFEVCNITAVAIDEKDAKKNSLPKKNLIKNCTTITYEQPYFINVGKGKTKEEALEKNKKDFIPDMKNLFTGKFNIDLDAKNTHYKVGDNSIIISGDTI